MNLLPDALPSTCRPGRYPVGGIYDPSLLLVETEYQSDGTRIERSYTLDQLRTLLLPYVPDDYADGSPILNSTWEALQSANLDDSTLSRFCDGMIRAGKGEAWAPLLILSPAPTE